MKKPILFLAAIATLFSLYRCVDADPLRPDGPILEVDKVNIVFDELFTSQTETQEVEIKNTGDSDLIINDLIINDNLDGEFKIELSNRVLPVGTKDIISITFQPSGFERYSRDLIIKSNFENDVLIRLDGAGIPKVSNQKVWNFKSQSAVDAFAKESYDIVSDVEELLISSSDNITGDPIIDISALNLIKEVNRLEISDNPKLEDLTGIEDLLVKSELIVAFNDALTSLNLLNGLVSSDFSIEINSNRLLQNLSFLSGLTLIGDLKVENNLSISDFTGLEDINTIDGDLLIQDNRSLRSLKGLEGVTIAIVDEENIDGENRIIDDVSIRNNRVLDDLCGIQSIINNPNGDTVYGNIVIENNGSTEITLEKLKMGMCK